MSQSVIRRITGARVAPMRQRGVALVVVIVLLLLASVMSLYALRVGLFEQQASANHVQAKYVQQLADSAISEGVEFLRLQGPEFTRFGAAHWVRCGDAEETFPCGALPPDRRGSMYAYQGPGAGVIERRTLPMDRELEAVGNGFVTEYGAGMAICWIARGSTEGDLQCATSSDDASNVFMVTAVGLASIPGETARATAVQTLGAYSLTNDLNVPPILASGSVRLRGTIKVVANANAAGPGVPVSVWTRDAMDPNGTPKTCYAGDFFRSGSAQYKGDTDFVVCRDCDCNTDSLSYQGAGNRVCPGIDILSTGSTDTTQCPDANEPIDPLNPTEFPCDLFHHVFGIRAWEDLSSPPDNFCETKRYVEDPDDSSLRVPADIAYLESAARVVTCADLTNAALAPTLSGLIWVRQNCNLANVEIGSPQAPVMLVADRGVQFRAAGTELFGLVFVRDNSCDARIGPEVARCVTTGEASGGVADFEFTSGRIYGAVVIQGRMSNGAGQGAVVYSEDVIAALRNLGVAATYNTIPGSWTDRVRY